MEYSFREEEKYSIDNVEVPVQCIVMQAFKENFENEPVIKMHYHDYVEILYGLDCDLTVWCYGTKYNLKSGGLAVINSKNPHTVTSNSDCSTYVVIKFMPQILYAAEQSVLEFRYIIPFITSGDEYKKLFDASEVEGSDIPDIMEKIVYEWERRDYAFEIAVRMYAIRIAVWLLRSWQAVHGYNAPGVTPEVLGAIQKSVEYVQKNYSAATSREAAVLCAMSHSYFSRIFKRVMKRSFVDYVNYVRISEAQRMLVGTEKSVTDVALDVGFSTSSYFIDKFRKQVHMTPNQFAMRFRKST